MARVCRCLIAARLALGDGRRLMLSHERPCDVFV